MGKFSNRQRIFTFLIVVLECTIFYFSSKTATDSSAASSGVILWLHQFFPKIIDNHFFQLVVRKGAHISEFALLSFFSFEAFRYNDQYHMLPSILLVFFSACFDEFHQLFVPGRAGMFIDVGIDMIGCIIMIMIYLLIDHIRSVFS